MILRLGQAAEERYSREVVAHAETIKAVEDLKQQLAKVQSSARDYQTSSETAQAKLATSETSWKQQKETLEKEIADLNTRYGPPVYTITEVVSQYITA